MYEIFGPYQLIERLASGGMAEIFKAKTSGHSGFEKTLVIKRLHPRYTQTPEFVEMLKDEAKTAVGLSHANIVQIFDLGRVQEHYYIAMEYINGRDLNQMMNKFKEKQKLVPPEAVLHIASEVCAGLDFAHRQRDTSGRLLRLIHRDISPQNIMVSVEGEVKIVDFGIAKSLASHQETESGVIKGKFCFMSPEQARGQKLDHRTDIFSVGIMLYELLSGRAMYENHDDHQLLQQVRNAHFTPLEELRPDLPRAVHKLVRKTLTFDREQRYPSARHLQHALEKVMQRSSLMYSRFQLGQFLCNSYPQLTSNIDDAINSYDDFDNEEVSLISDYEPQRRGGDDWDVPEFTDEIEEVDLEEVDLEDYTDQSPLHGGGQASIEASPISAPPRRTATPVPVGRLSGMQGYAPAAPVSSAHLYDPSYEQPHQNGLGVAHHGQVTQPPQGVSAPVIDDQVLYSGQSPSLQRAPLGPRGNDSFQDQVDSTMILEEESQRGIQQPLTYNERNGRSAQRSQRAQNGRGGYGLKPSFKEQWARVLTKLKYFANHPQGRYLIAALGFCVVFGIATLVKKRVTLSEESPVSQMKSEAGQPVTLRLGQEKPNRDPLPSGKRGQNLRVNPQRLANAGQGSVRTSNVQEARREPAPSNGYESYPQRDVTQRDPIRRGSNRDTNMKLDVQGYQEPNGSRPTPTSYRENTLDRRALSPQNSRSRSETMPGYQVTNRRDRVTSNLNSMDQPRMLTVRIITDPPQAEVAINDEWHKDTTPITTQIPQGQMVLLTFSKEGYDELREKVWPRADEPMISFKLTSQSGHLIINSEPPGVSIRKDGKLLGETPYERQDIPLQPAEFRVELSKRGYKSKAYRMSWLNADRGTLELEATLIKKERSKPRRKKTKRRSSQVKRRPSGSGYISVKASRWGHLFVDNRFVKDGKIVLKHKVSSGRHRVKFCFEGDRGNCAQKSISVSKGSHKKVFF